MPVQICTMYMRAPPGEASLLVARSTVENYTTLTWTEQEDTHERYAGKSN